MDINQLKLFISVSRTLNFTRTANEFFMSQPTVSNQIRALESELGVDLLQRSSHHVSLTKAGTEYLDYATKIVDLQSAAEIRLRNISTDRPGYVRIAMLSSCAPHFLKALEVFSEKNPKVQVDVDMLEGGEMIRALNMLDYDIYFANEPLLPRTTDKIEYAIIDESQLHLFANEAIASTIDMNDWSTISCHPFVSMQSADFSLFHQIDQICVNRGFKPDIINFYNRADMLLLSVASGSGLTILPKELIALSNLQKVVHFPISGEDAVIRSAVAWKSHSDNPDAAKFVKIALDK